jgi:RNA polymerase sigma factor (TIGR02999 family)
LTPTNQLLRPSLTGITGWHKATSSNFERPRTLAESTPFIDRAHFLGIAARVMRQVLVDHARAARAQKRGAHLTVHLNEQLLAAQSPPALLELDEALERLEREDPRLVTLVEMRFFAGMTAEETAAIRSESVHVIRHDLRYAQARLRRFLSGSKG